MWAWRGIFRKTLSGNYYVKFGHFSGKYHVKFGYFVKFACIYFPAKVLPPKLTELLWHTHMVLITYSGKHFSRQLLCKIWHFSHKYHVKFGHFVNFSYIYFLSKVLPPKLTEVLQRTPMALITHHTTYYVKEHTITIL